jgi:hypothetical protein
MCALCLLALGQAGGRFDGGALAQLVVGDDQLERGVGQIGEVECRIGQFGLLRRCRPRPGPPGSLEAADLPHRDGHQPGPERAWIARLLRIPARLKHDVLNGASIWPGIRPRILPLLQRRDCGGPLKAGVCSHHALAAVDGDDLSVDVSVGHQEQGSGGGFLGRGESAEERRCSGLGDRIVAGQQFTCNGTPAQAFALVPEEEKKAAEYLLRVRGGHQSTAAAAQADSKAAGFNGQIRVIRDARLGRLLGRPSRALASCGCAGGCDLLGRVGGANEPGRGIGRCGN